MNNKGIALVTTALALAFTAVLVDQANPQSAGDRVRVCATSPTAGALVRNQPSRLTAAHSNRVLYQTLPYWVAQDRRTQGGWASVTGGSLTRTVFSVNFESRRGPRVYVMTLRFNRTGRGCGISRLKLATISLA